MSVESIEPGLYTLAHPNARAVLIDGDPFAGQASPECDLTPWGATVWPARWVAPPETPGKPFDVLYRLAFSLDRSAVVRVHVSADERYELRVDGARVGRGPQRGDGQHWSFETYDLDLQAGTHVLWAWVSSPGEAGFLAPSAQLSRGHGFLLAAEGPWGARLNTGTASWEHTVVTGVAYEPPVIREARFAGGTQRISGGGVNWKQLAGAGDGWEPVTQGAYASDGGPRWGELLTVRPLLPARLPPMLERAYGRGVAVRFVGRDSEPVRLETHQAADASAWRDLLAGGGPLQIEADTRCDVLLDLREYVCAYPVLDTAEGEGASVALEWAEALYRSDNPHSNDKSHRDEVDGLYFRGKGDVFIADGQPRTYAPVWWRCGRYVRVRIQAEGEPLLIRGLRFMETRYPLEPLPLPELSDVRLSAALPLMQRAVQVCMHETFMDSPYYEQLQYVGDTRLQALVALSRGGDDRLPRRAVELYGWSMTHLGLTQARYPSSTPQIIAGFCLWWVAMLHDLARWVGVPAFVGAQLPVARSVIEAFLARVGGDGLLGPMPGWQFADWAEGWPFGVPPGAQDEPHALFNWHLIYTLERMAELESWAGDEQIARRCLESAGALTRRVEEVFFDEAAGLYADDAGYHRYSEHTQCLAVLSGRLDAERACGLMSALKRRPDATQTTIYFGHYKLEALAAVGDGAALLGAMELWRGLPERGFVATPEQPEPTRSDCHGWGGHPLYHTVASVLGLQPDGMAFDAVRLRPCLGPLAHVSAQVPHPKGVIEALAQQDAGRIQIALTLPDGLHGTLQTPQAEHPLSPGLNEVAYEAGGS